MHQGHAQNMNDWGHLPLASSTMPLMRAPIALSLAGCLLIAGCRGKAVATAELHGAGTADATFTSDGKPLVFWADTDGKWTGGEHSHLAVHYEIDILSKGAKIGHVACDTANSSVSVCGMETTVNSSHSGDCELKLPCEVPSIPAGEASVHVTATLGKNVTDVKKISLKVRAD